MARKVKSAMAAKMKNTAKVSRRPKINQSGKNPASLIIGARGRKVSIPRKAADSFKSRTDHT